MVNEELERDEVIIEERPVEVIRVLHHIDDNFDWKEHVPGISKANWSSHCLSQASQYHKTSNPYVWSPGEVKVHHMRRGLFTAVVKRIGKVTNIGRHNVPVGHVGISENNGRLVLLGPGNHWMISPNHKYHGHVSIGQPDDKTSHIDLLRQVMIVYVKEGYISYVQKRGEYIKLLQGVHVLEDLNLQFKKTIPLNSDVIELGNVEIITVPNGFVGFALDAFGTLLKLDSGKHILENPAQTFSRYRENQPFVSLNERVIQKKPYLRTRVEGNEVCVISDQKGEFQLLGCGVHEYFNPNVTLKDYLPLSQRNLAIKPVEPFKTSDNADVRVSFDVYFEIAEPDHTIKSLCDPEQCQKKGDLLARICDWVREKSIDAMASVIIHYQATDIAVIPDVKSISRSDDNRRTNEQAPSECVDRFQLIRQEFIFKLAQSLESVGIKLDSINLSSGLQIISNEARNRVEGLIGAGAKEQLMMAEQRAMLVKADTERQTAEIQAQILQLQTTTQAETQQRLLISNAEAKQKATKIEAETNALLLKTKIEVLIGCLGHEKAFEFLKNEQNVSATKSTFANATTVVTGNFLPPSFSGLMNNLPFPLQTQTQTQTHVLEEIVEERNERNDTREDYIADD